MDNGVSGEYSLNAGRNLIVDDDLMFIADMDSVQNLVSERSGIFFILCLKGEMQVKLENGKHNLHQYDLLIFRSSELASGFLRRSEDNSHYAIFASQSMLYNFYPDHDIRFEVSLLSSFRYHEIDESTVDIICSHKLLIEHVWDGSLSMEFRNRVLRLQAVSMFRVIQGALSSDVELLQRKRLVSQPDKLFMQFNEILSSEVNKRKPLEYYANQLYISPKYLSAVCRKVAGTSAYKIILDAAIADVKYALRNTDIAISELSEQFGFSSISFFGQFVKKYTGLSPREYRRGDDAE